MSKQNCAESWRRLQHAAVVPSERSIPASAIKPVPDAEQEEIVS